MVFLVKGGVADLSGGVAVCGRSQAGERWKLLEPDGSKESEPGHIHLIDHQTQRAADQ